MSLVIVAFKNAPTPTPEWKAKDEALDKEIRNKTIGKKSLVVHSRSSSSSSIIFLEILNRHANKTNIDANAVWQQVVTSLNDQSSIREALPIGGGFISK